MPDWTIPLDPTNPAQYLACCGLFELLHLDGAEPQAHFRVDPRLPRRAAFLLTAERPVELKEVLAELKRDVFEAESGVSQTRDLMPYRLKWKGKIFSLDWWLDMFRLEKSEWKCWSGQVTPEKLFSELPSLLPDSENFMNYAANTKTKIGLDPRSAWEALDIGFSPNEHDGADVYPAVELLAAIGLQGFRPARSSGRRYTYALWLRPLPVQVARSAPWEGLPCVSYSFQVGVRGSYRYFEFAQPLLERNSYVGTI